MSTFWSTEVQTPQELYSSRALRFREDNAADWFRLIGVKDGMKVLEMGCGGGLFCHRIKKALPNCWVNGVDLDENHISFAREKALELGLMDCRFLRSDALSAPFGPDVFDLVFSYTVAEHLPPDKFLAEHMRLLKSGGTACVLSVRPKLNLQMEEEEASPEEAQLLEKLWKNTPDISDPGRVCAYPMSEREYACLMEKSGFENVSVGMLTVFDYAPDSADISPEIAREMIEARRIGQIEPVIRAYTANPNALSPAELERLGKLIDEKFDRRLARYENGEKLWDMRTSTVFCVRGVKP